MTVTATVDRDAIRAEVLAHYGPHARRRVFRGGSLRRAFVMEKEEEREPGTHVNDRIDFIEEERWAHRHRVWDVEAVIEAVARLRALGHRDITLGDDGRVSVEVGEGEPCGRESARAFYPIDLRMPPVRIRDRRSCCDPIKVYSEMVADIDGRPPGEAAP